MTLEQDDALQAGGLSITIDMVKRGARGIAEAEAQGWPIGATQIEIDQIIARVCLRAALRPGGGA